jgi:hypothetical protein
VGIIYETVNLHNKERGITPWRYIGSDQYNNPAYLGSSVDLKADIKKLGKDQFIKNILEDAGDIDNKMLRQLEVDKYLKPNKVRTDSSYYNKTERYAPGGGSMKGRKHSKPRSLSHREQISKCHTGSKKSESARQLMRERKLGTKASIDTRKKMSQSHSGEKNSNALEWTITTPSGETLNIKGLRRWAEDNGHNYYHIYGNTHGWKAVKHGQGKGGPGHKKKEHTSGN